MEYPKQEGMTRVNIKSMNLKEKRLDTGKQNMKIILGKKNIQTFLL